MNDSNQTPPAKRRLFLALWPGEQLQQSFFSVAQQCHQQTGGKLIDKHKLHITLVFLGNVDDEQQQCIEEVADSISLPAFSLRMEQTGFWPRPRVSWLAPRQVPSELNKLVEQLNERLAKKCGFKPESRIYRPHLTVSRKVKKHPHVEMEPVDWQVDSFSLIESRNDEKGTHYIKLKTWPLLP